MEDGTIGYSTSFNLRRVRDGIVSENELQRQLRLEKRFYSQKIANYYLSLQETLAILQSQKKDQQSPRVLIALIRDYQVDIEDIEKYPGCWTNTYLTPETARAWYERQIEVARQQLSVTSQAAGERRINDGH